jgi:hypothetical protein
MKTRFPFLVFLSLFVGVISVFIGMFLSGSNPSGSMSVVVGGGLFIALGISAIFLSRDN